MGYLPKYFTNYAIAFYCFLLLACSVLSSAHILPSVWMAFGLIEVVFFFHLTHRFTKNWLKKPNRIFEKNLFRLALLIRIAFVIFSYQFFIFMTGQPFEFGSADAYGYHKEAEWLTELLKNNKFDIYMAYIGNSYSDMGYPVYLAFIYSIIGSEIFWLRIIKSFIGAFSVLLIYRIAVRNFGLEAGRSAGLMAALLPNFIYYCGLHLKEIEMVFILLLFINSADILLRSKVLSFSNLVILLLSAGLLFFFRTVLAVCMVLSLLLAAFTISGSISTKRRRMLIGFWIMLAGAFVYNSAFGDNINEYLVGSDRNLESQMEHFSNREGGNRFARFGSRSIFAPIILIAPFPTMTNTGQENLMMLNGAFYIRNVYSFFVFTGLFFLYYHQKLTSVILILAALFSYLLVLTSSGFALSERFHMPIVPFLLMIAAYGITKLNLKVKYYFMPYMLLISLLVLGWNWFKLAGRGF